ncbi:Glutathione S-transferase 1 [Nymphon striatum]|nr:Glutathione S-transferase 1 [Nymphon striatum]
MPKYTITYFDAKGRAEISRLILAYKEVDFEDVRVAQEDWPKVKPTLPTGQVPLLTLEDGTTLPQSFAIARYLAREHDLVGRNNLEAANADALVDGIIDMVKEVAKVLFGSEEDKKAAKEACLIAIPKALVLFETNAEKRSTDYLVSDQITWADLFMASTIDALKEILGENIADELRIMPKYTITYFDAKGRAEICRLILAYKEVDFEDVRLTREEWPKVKPTLPTGQVPLLTLEDGTTLPQSFAIARYLAREHDLVGRNNLEAANADALVDGVVDMTKEVRKVLFGSEEDKKAAKEACLIAIPKALVLFETNAEKRSTDYLVSDQITWADLFMASTIEALKDILGENIADGAPKLLAHRERIVNIPSIKTYLENRKKTPF